MASSSEPAAAPSLGAGRRVLITGANRGLGYEVAKVLIRHGHRVWGSARQAGPKALLALDPAGTLQLDQGDATSVAAAVAALGEQTDALDMLINCAGIDGREVGADPNARGPFDVDAGVFTEVMRINVTGPMLITTAVLGLLRAGASPMIVNFSSQLGSMQVAKTMGRDTAYCVSKAALNMYSVKCASALRPEGIGVVMLHPGWVRTDMGGPSGTLDPVEAATAIVDTVLALDLADSGRFIQWDGQDHPW